MVYLGLVGNTEDIVSNPGTGKYIVARMITENDSSLSLGLKNRRDIDKWLSLSLCLSVRGIISTRKLGLFVWGSLSLSHVVQGDSGLNINIHSIQYDIVF